MCRLHTLTKYKFQSSELYIMAPERQRVPFQRQRSSLGRAGRMDPPCHRTLSRRRPGSGSLPFQRGWLQGQGVGRERKHEAGKGTRQCSGVKL